MAQKVSELLQHFIAVEVDFQRAFAVLIFHVDLAAGHAKVLLGLPTQDLMRQAAAEIEANGLNVRQTEALCKKLAKPAKPPKPKPDPFNRPKRAVEIEAALKEVTGSEVHGEYKDGKGSLKIYFYSD